ncbi:MAG: ubiquitin-protein transferase activating protein, partial [Paramarteilia canceri]
RHKFQRTGSEYSLKEISMNNTSNLNQISTLNNRSGINKSLLNSFQSSIRQDPILSCLNSTLTREVKTEPIKVLDASGSINNFYFNPLDWSESNIVGICLGQQVALLNFKNDKSSVVSKIHHEDEMFSCFEWVPRSNYCSIGNSKGIVQIYDIVKKSVLRNIDAKIDNCINTMSFKSSTVAI